MTTMPSEIFSRGVQNAISHKGFRPELFTVAGGSYASNQVYGSGAPLVHNYSSETKQEKSSASIRQHDRDIDFSIKLVLDLTSIIPLFSTGEELRLRTFRPLWAGEPGRYLKSLPVSDSNYSLPMFLDVEIIDPATGAPPPGFPSIAGIGDLQARLLYGGELALVVVDHTAGPPPLVTPLTAGDLVSLFGGQGEDELYINVRGTYRSRNNPN